MSVTIEVDNKNMEYDKNETVSECFYLSVYISNNNLKSHILLNFLF